MEVPGVEGSGGKARWGYDVAHGRDLGCSKWARSMRWTRWEEGVMLLIPFPP